MSSITPVPTIDKYPTIDNPGVYQSGPSEFTLKHPDNLAGATVLLTIRSSTIFEIFDHHAAILKLPHISVELKPEPLSWAELTNFWNTHAAEDGPRFVTWDAELGYYLHPLEIVTLADFNITCRPAPKVVSDITTVPKADADTYKLKRVISNVPGVSRVNSFASLHLCRRAI